MMSAPAFASGLTIQDIGDEFTAAGKLPDETSSARSDEPVEDYS
jgi:hypothetical protein